MRWLVDSVIFIDHFNGINAATKFIAPAGLPRVIPAGPPSVIPDVFNRESMAFPKQGRTNERTEEKNTGFPLNPVPDVCYRGTGRNDRGHPSLKPIRHISPSIQDCVSLSAFVSIFDSIF